MSKEIINLAIFGAGVCIWGAWALILFIDRRVRPWMIEHVDARIDPAPLADKSFNAFLGGGILYVVAALVVMIYLDYGWGWVWATSPAWVIVGLIGIGEFFAE